MKTIILAAIRCSLMFATAAAFSVAYPAKANLITNGGFETGDFSGWTVSGRDNEVEGSVPFIPPHSGNFQAQFGIGNNSITQNVATTPGSSYVVDFWLAAKIFNPVGVPFLSIGLARPFSATCFHLDYTVTRSTSSPSMR